MLIAITAIGITTIIHIEKSNDINKKLGSNIDSFIDKEITIKTDHCFITERGDSAQNSLRFYDFTIIRYISDSKDCLSCQMHMHKYRHIIEDMSEYSDNRIGLIYVIRYSNNNEIIKTIRRENKYGYQVIIDSIDIINDINKFPKTKNLQTFLIDKNKRVIAVGDPAVSPKVHQLYVNCALTHCCHQ